MDFLDIQVREKGAAFLNNNLRTHGYILHSVRPRFFDRTRKIGLPAYKIES